MRSPLAATINKDLDVPGNEIEISDDKLIVPQGYNTAGVHCQTEVACETQMQDEEEESHPSYEPLFTEDNQNRAEPGYGLALQPKPASRT